MQRILLLAMLLCATVWVCSAHHDHDHDHHDHDPAHDARDLTHQPDPTSEEVPKIPTSLAVSSGKPVDDSKMKNKEKERRIHRIRGRIEFIKERKRFQRQRSSRRTAVDDTGVDALAENDDDYEALSILIQARPQIRLLRRRRMMWAAKSPKRRHHA